jgi:hypothetical protein
MPEGYLHNLPVGLLHIILQMVALEGDFWRKIWGG